MASHQQEAKEENDMHIRHRSMPEVAGRAWQGQGTYLAILLGVGGGRQLQKLIRK